MKKISYLLLSLFAVLLFAPNLKAACNKDEIEELREWATKAKGTITLTEGDYSGYASKYAYLMSVTPAREGIVVEVSDSYGNKTKAKLFEDINLYGVGCFTNLEEMTYTIKVYSECSNELLKTIKYTVPRLNRMLKDEYCEKYPEHELCATFTDKTKDMTEKEFNEAMKKYDEEHTDKSFLSKVFKVIREYGIYILIPFLLITLVYVINIQEFKKKERKK